jgi:hypothetical protein
VNDDIVADMSTPEGEAKLAPLTDALKERGSKTPAAEVMLLAQKDDRTSGKAPAELAEMIVQDPSVLDDLEGMKPGGAIDKAYTDLGAEPPMGKPSKEPATETPEDEEKSMGSFLGDSASMKDADPKKGLKAKKDMGGKSPRNMNFDKKAEFMSRIENDNP